MTKKIKKLKVEKAKKENANNPRQVKLDFIDKNGRYLKTTLKYDSIGFLCLDSNFYVENIEKIESDAMIVKELLNFLGKYSSKKINEAIWDSLFDNIVPHWVKITTDDINRSLEKGLDLWNLYEYLEENYNNEKLIEEAFGDGLQLNLLIDRFQTRFTEKIRDIYRRRNR